MRISLNWLRELVDFTITPEELAHKLTMAGFEVEDIEDRRTWADGVVVGKVLSCQPHPNADKLRVCEVDIGSGTPLNIVCGAANVKTDLFVPVATIGTYLPKVDLKLRSTKLRGVRSEGMICSLAELGLEKESSGIHSFDPESGPLGGDVRPLLGLDDVILDLTATANRADALSMIGIAREVAALTGATLKLPEVPESNIPGGNKEVLSLKIAEPQACPAYIGTVIENVKIGPSPDWLQQRLQGAGIRPINNVVDITNYVLLEWGQPLHAFDRQSLQKVTGKDSLTIGVRLAKTEESLKTLDGQTRNLQPQALLITANDRPVALAGVMGGEETEVSAQTQSIMLEAALFDPTAIRRSARSLGMRTEASGRYERGVNQAELELACRRAIGLISELAVGAGLVNNLSCSTESIKSKPAPTSIAQEIADNRPNQSAWTRSIELRLDRVNQILGPIDLGEELGELQPEDIRTILTSLGCEIKPTEEEGIWLVTVPPYRYRDLEREIDLIEEIARLYGYDNFSIELPEETEPGYLSIDQMLTRKLREALRGAGLTELVHYSLGKAEGDGQIKLRNPMFSEYSALRNDLISGLIDSFQYNLEQGNGALNGFEIGRIFWSEEDGLMEADSLAGIIGGDPTVGRWVNSGKSEPMTWYEAKGMLESVFQKLGINVEYQPDCRDSRLHPGRTASLWVQGDRLGTFGQLHPQIRQEKGLPDAVYVFELDLDVLLDQMNQDEILTPVLKPYSSYPASDRDIAFFASTKVSVAEMERVMAKAAGTLLESVELFDQYLGESVPEGQRSLAFRLIYRAGDRTLTEEDIESVHQQVREALTEKFQVTLRS
ncbi:phenylalanine--tRNA ligase subunit beta [Aerosakkonemataceae cyanobacterium BLCC-F154]|uniref:Phenylalanine--tRNA ligase beta subunit n=1 Tax=Floridaenema fluviatile BLCC-F154 TaxID=3153640 RepID=A0ABV4Y8W4_9CYAN